MIIKKVKYDGTKVNIEYAIEKKQVKDVFTLESTEKPLPEFRNALNDLKPFFEEICELPAGYSDNIEVRGVSFSYGGENDTMGATITGLKPLKTANAPLVINTPHLPSEDYSGNNDMAKTLPSDSIYYLNELQRQAERFIDGEREPDKQESLFAN